MDHKFSHTLDDTKQVALKGLYCFTLIQNRILRLSTVSFVTLWVFWSQRESHVSCCVLTTPVFFSLIISWLFPIQGAYKNGALISALYKLSSAEMNISGYHFSESQAGKVRTICVSNVETKNSGPCWSCDFLLQKEHAWLDSRRERYCECSRYFQSSYSRKWDSKGTISRNSAWIIIGIKGPIDIPLHIYQQYD